jgi:hypothetical protein
MKTGLIVILFWCLSSCFTKEEPMALPSGNSEIATLSLGTNYEREVFFDLSSNTFQERRWADWDLRFEASKDGYGVFINTGKDMFVRNTGYVGLIQTLDTNKFGKSPKLVDFPEGQASVSAIGNWRQYNLIKPPPQISEYMIFIIQMDYKSGYERFKRLQIQDADDTCFKLVITDLYDKGGLPVTSGKQIIIPKDPDRNYTYFSFEKGIIKDAEPYKNSWDFEFTRYKHIFFNILPDNKPWAYTLSGVLNNPNNVQVARDSAVTAFEDIDVNTISKYQLTTNRNTIGYDWKTHAFSGVGNYSIAPKLSFIIRDTDGHYYKLRFLDYNNNLGIPGYPKFEFIRLK